MPTDINLLKIGKLATPAAAVLVGGYLVNAGYFPLGVVLIITGIVIYILAGYWLKEVTKALAKSEVSKSKLKLKAEEVKTRRVEASTAQMLQRHSLQAEAQKRAVYAVAAKRIIDEL